MDQGLGLSGLELFGVRPRRPGKSVRRFVVHGHMDADQPETPVIGHIEAHRPGLIGHLTLAPEHLEIGAKIFARLIASAQLLPSARMQDHGLGLSIAELGVWGTILHIFGPKGGLQGMLKYLLMPIFIFVGLIEVLSIAFRPMSLSLRLFGNIFAGETLLHTMGELGEKLGLHGWAAFLTSVIFPLPFYFMELLVGVLQATVFSLLCAVYIKLATTHDEEAHH